MHVGEPAMSLASRDRQWIKKRKRPLMIFLIDVTALTSLPSFQTVGGATYRQSSVPD